MTAPSSTNPDDLSKEDLKRLLDNAAEASISAGSRSRNILILLCFSSLLAFMASWNARESSWVRMRHNRIKSLYTLYHHADSLKEYNHEKIENDSLLEDSEIELLQTLDIRHKQDLDDYRRIYTELKKEIYLVKVPILGFSFDINDLGMVSGITFSLLLLILWFAQEREDENLRLTMKAAEKNDLLDIYYIKLWMGQVLMVPPLKGPRSTIKWGLMLKLLFLLPLLCQLYIFWNDFKTVKYGYTFSHDSTHDLIAKSLTFLIIVGLLTSIAIAYTFKKEKLWRKYRKRLRGDMMIFSKSNVSEI